MPAKGFSSVQIRLRMKVKLVSDSLPAAANIQEDRNLQARRQQKPLPLPTVNTHHQRELRRARLFDIQLPQRTMHLWPY